MPQNDRHRSRVVPIEFNEKEDLTNLPMQERVTLILAIAGKAVLKLNGSIATMIAPSVLCLSQYDNVELIQQTGLTAKSFSFKPVFLNSSLTFEALEVNNFTKLEDEHDRNMLKMFLRRDLNYNGILVIPPNMYVRLFEWMNIIGKETYAQSDGSWTCRIRRYLLQSLYLIDDIYKDGPNTQRNKSIADYALEYIHTNYQNDITLNSLCDYIHSNRTTLNKKFKDLTGRTTMDYLLHYRLKIACETLAHTNLTLSEIAEACGFKFDTYLIKQFTIKMGTTPTQYRNNSKQR